MLKKGSFMPKIIKISGLYELPKEVKSQNISERFEYIYKTGVWLNGSKGESYSGRGSTKDFTRLYLSQLTYYLELVNKSLGGREIDFFDAPCGDLNWITNLFTKVNYLGGDISKGLIHDLNKKFPNINTTQFDITVDTFPTADIWHCRHCLFHLSLSDIAKSLENFCNSEIDVALITNHFLPDSVTFDIDTGSFRFLDLTNFPFYLPAPKMWLLDNDPASGQIGMATGVWNKEQIKVGVENYNTLIIS